MRTGIDKDNDETHIVSPTAARARAGGADKHNNEATAGSRAFRLSCAARIETPRSPTHIAASSCLRRGEVHSVSQATH